MNTIDFETAKNDPRIVTLVNIAYHNEEADLYDINHPEIFEAESNSWKNLAKPIILELRKQSNALMILDIGTGTGFVPKTISPFLSQDDTVVLSDISAEMLDKAEKRLKSEPFKKQILLTLSGYKSLQDSSFDLITINSVLHHIPVPEQFFFEVDRILKPGGMFIIKHEPNIYFTRNIFLRETYKFLRMLKSGGNHGFLASTDDMLKKVLHSLEKENLKFFPPLTVGELQSLVDIHSPTANGGLRSGVGFDPFTIAQKNFKDASTISCNTYGHLGKFNEKANIFRRLVVGTFRKIFPKDGYFFDLIIIKNK